MTVLAESRALHGIGFGGTSTSLITQGRQIFGDLAGFKVKRGAPVRTVGCVARRQT